MAAQAPYRDTQPTMGRRPTRRRRSSARSVHVVSRNLLAHSQGRNRIFEPGPRNVRRGRRHQTATAEVAKVSSPVGGANGGRGTAHAVSGGGGPRTHIFQKVRHGP